jgi:hypothetical protein
MAGSFRLFFLYCSHSPTSSVLAGGTRANRVRVALRSCASGMAKAIVVVMIWAVGSIPAAAQSFLEQLFGASPARPVLQAPPQRLSVPGFARPSLPALTGAQSVTGDDNEGGARTSSPRSRELRDDGKTYQTMCVRTCDGYFWPATYPVSRSEFQREAAVCEATCGAQTRLFYRPGPGTDPEEMRDLDGRSYGATPNAFRYRKGLIDGCACKPMPWSDGERARHESYALIEAEKDLRREQAEAERVATINAAAEALAAKIASLEPKPARPVRAEIFVSPADDVVVHALALAAAVPMVSVVEPIVVAEAREVEMPERVDDVARLEAAEGPLRARARGKARREVAGVVPAAREKRATAPAVRPVAKVQMVVAQPKASGGLFGIGAGGGKYTYPGDR